MDLRNQRFGIEVEMTGLTRKHAAEITARYFGTSNSEFSHYGEDAYSVRDSQHRNWKFVYDSSIDAKRKLQGRLIEADNSYKVEMVSPICKWDDIAVLQELVRKLRSGGAISGEKCGIHIHVDAAPHTAVSLRNLINIMASKENLIYKALGVNADRRAYCEKSNPMFVRELNLRKPRTVDSLVDIWRNGEAGNQGRYRCLNLQCLSDKGTVEFRVFNSSVNHTGKIKAYIQFCLAISAQALNQKSASYTNTQSSNEKYTFRTWLLRLGLIGDEFKTARLHLLNNLEGNIAWKDPAQAEAQRERLRLSREAENEPETQYRDNDQSDTGDEPAYCVTM